MHTKSDHNSHVVVIENDDMLLSTANWRARIIHPPRAVHYSLAHCLYIILVTNFKAAAHVSPEEETLKK